MKLKALAAAVAIAFGATAFAQTSSPAAPGGSPTPAATAPDAGKTTMVKPMKKAKKKSKKMMAKKVAMHHHAGTHAMGAGPSGRTDMHASSRQARMDAAYADFKAGRR